MPFDPDDFELPDFLNPTIEADSPLGEFLPDPLVEKLARLIRRKQEQGEALIEPWMGGAEPLTLCHHILHQAHQSWPRRCDVLMDLSGKGTSLADELDRKEAARLAAWQAFQQDILHRQIILGSRLPPSHSSIIAFDDRARPVAQSLLGGQVILQVGIPGSGKSHATALMLESWLKYIPGINNQPPPPTAVVSFYLDPSGISLPGLLAGLWPNSRQRDIDFLWDRLRVQPTAIERITLVVPQDLMDQYRELLGPYLERGLRLVPLRLRLSELGQAGLEALLGVDTEAQYVRHLLQAALDRGDLLTLEWLCDQIDKIKEMSDSAKRLARGRLRLLKRVASLDHSVWDFVEPGRLTVIALGGKWLGPRDALPIVVALMNAIAQPSKKLGPMHRVYVLDDVNHMEGDELTWRQVVTTARQIRHRGSSLMINGQDLFKAPDALLGLATRFDVFRLISPKVYQDVRERVGGFGGWAFNRIAQLGEGESVTMVTEATQEEWRQGAQWLHHRPMCCEHGGHTRTTR